MLHLTRVCVAPHSVLLAGARLRAMVQDARLLQRSARAGLHNRISANCGKRVSLQTGWLDYHHVGT